MGRTWLLGLAFAAFVVLAFVAPASQAQSEDPVFEAEVASTQPIDEEEAAAIKAFRGCLPAQVYMPTRCRRGWSIVRQAKRL